MSVHNEHVLKNLLLARERNLAAGGGSPGAAKLVHAFATLGYDHLLPIDSKLSFAARNNIDMVVVVVAGLGGGMWVLAWILRRQLRVFRAMRAKKRAALQQQAQKKSK